MKKNLPTVGNLADSIIRDNPNYFDESMKSTLPVELLNRPAYDSNYFAILNEVDCVRFEKEKELSKKIGHPVKSCKMWRVVNCPEEATNLNPECRQLIRQIQFLTKLANSIFRK